jgi:microcystin-dependent protein
MALEYPSLIPGIFAASANSHEDIPDTDAAEGRMAWDVGFPAETSQPIAAGGVPPRRLDMNGLGNRLSQHILWQQSGGLYNWNASLDYPAGAHVLGSNGQEYIALAANGPSTSNAMNPVSDVNFTVWKSFARSLVDIIYPVGSIYMSANNASPATLFGGSWTRIQGRFLLAAGGNYALGSQGGAATVMLTVENMPAHNHGVTVGNNTHSHSVTIAAKTISVTTGSTSITHNHAVTFPQTTFANATSNTGEHTHTRGTMDITGRFAANGLMEDVSYTSGAFSIYNTSSGWGDPDKTGSVTKGLQFTASGNWTGSTSTNGNHRHNVTIPATSMTCGNAGGSHTHSVSITVPAQTVTSASNTHTHTVTVSSAGGGAAFSIMPPYLAVNVWQRTA